MFTIQKKLLSIRDTMEIHIVDHEYEIERGGDKVAEVSKRWFRMRDVFGIEIAEGRNDALLLAVAVCIDQMSHSAAG